MVADDSSRRPTPRLPERPLSQDADDAEPWWRRASGLEHWGLIRCGYPGRSSIPETVDPRRPHEYRAKSDSGIGALSPIGGGIGGQVSDIASAGAYTRTLFCGVPGCGKPRDDLIHAPADE